jgi:hypothetical protein
VETALNPQAPYRADVMSRLRSELHHPGELGRSIRQTLGRILGTEPLREVLVGGNTAMHHLFCGLDVEIANSHALHLSHAGQLRFADGELRWPGPAEFLPCLGGFVGSHLPCVSWPGGWTSRHVRTRSSTSARTARSCGLGARNCVRIHSGRSHLKAAVSARECERAGERSTVCTRARESSAAT